MKALHHSENWSIDMGKLGLISLILLLSSVMAGFGVMDGQTVRDLFLIITGYLVGNGVNAMRSQRQRGVFDPGPDEEDKFQSSR